MATKRKAKPTAKPRPAKSVAKATAKPARKPVAARDPDPLGSALAAIKAGRPDDALAPLLTAWRLGASAGTCAAELADVIAAISRRRKPIPAIRGKTKVALAAWTEVAERGDPFDIVPLLESLSEASSGDAKERLRLVERWMPDPRVDSALVDLLHAVPYRATSTQPFWNEVFRLAHGICDPRQLERLATADAEGVALTMGDRLRKKIAALRIALEERFRSTPSPDPRLVELAASLGAPKLSRGSSNLEALLHAIYDAPDDDAPRSVYADALLERGDPRGEFIMLQLAKSADRETRRREKDLLETHGKQWLGALEPVVMSGFTFERGFLATCKVENRHLDRVRALAGNLAWSTVSSIEGSALIALDPVMKALRRLSFVSYEARNHEELPDSWRDLLIGTPRPLESLRYTGIESDRQWERALEENQSVRPGIEGRWVHVPEAMELAALCECSALPDLRELILVDRPEVVVEPILKSAVLRRLTTLGLSYDIRSERRPPLEPIATLIATAPVPRLVLELGPDYHTTFVELERHDAGYANLTMTVGPTMRSNWSEQLINEAISILDALSPTLREVRITTRRNTDAAQFARLRTAVAQMDHLSVGGVS